MQVPQGTVLAHDCTAIQQLEWVKKLQTDWSDNSVSVTVYYKKHELPLIKDWLAKNYNTGVKTISFLLHSEHGFAQAPMEQITKEEFDEITNACTPIDSLSGICHPEENLDLLKAMECEGGACPLR
jgi:hypothetical protein